MPRDWSDEDANTHAYAHTHAHQFFLVPDAHDFCRDIDRCDIGADTATDDDRLGPVADTGTDVHLYVGVFSVFGVYDHVRVDVGVAVGDR